MSDAKSALEGVITFFNSSQAMRAEKTLSASGIACMAIPGPREISPNCGVALAFDYARLGEVEALIGLVGSSHEAIHHYPQARKIAGWF